MKSAELSKLAREISEIASAKGFKIASAESCTGGILAAALTELPGASAWFECGIVCYSNDSKMKLLGVSAKTLAIRGAVSEEIAREMCDGAIEKIAPKKNQKRIAIAVTGIAGPDGGTKTRPVGEVCFAWRTENEIASETQRFGGNRRAIRKAAAVAAAKGILERIF